MIYIKEHAWVLDHALGFVDVRGFIIGLFRFFCQVSSYLIEAPLLQRSLCTERTGLGGRIK